MREVGLESTPLVVPVPVKRSLNADEFSEKLDDTAAPFEKRLTDYAEKFHARLLKQVSGGLRRRSPA